MQAVEGDRTRNRPLPLYQDVDGFLLPTPFSPERFRSALKYQPVPGDLFVVTFPKSGTTWVQNIIASIYNGGKNFDSLKEFMAGCPFLELSGVDGLTQMKRPGSIKVHLPFHLVPYSVDAKYIFVARNPKDCCVSFYYHTKNQPSYAFADGTFDDYFEIFVNGKTNFGDYFDTLMSWYHHKDDENVLFLTYEALKENIEGQVLKIAEFLGRRYKELLMSDSALLSSVIQNSSFDSMKELYNRGSGVIIEKADVIVKEADAIVEEADAIVKEADAIVKEADDNLLSNENYKGTKIPHSDSKRPKEFMRKGIVGDWRNHFSESQCKRMAAKFLERTKGTELPKIWKNYM